MATPDMKNFFKQRKKNTGGISKPKSKSSSSSSSRVAAKKSTSSSPNHSASYGSDIAQPPALISHGGLDLQEDYDGNEDVLRQFDMNMAYGPCLGMSRLDRWNRAKALGLNPPIDVERLLRTGKAIPQCLWDGRV